MDAIAETTKVVLSDTVLEEFIALMEQVRDNQFAIGDKLIKLVTQHEGKKTEVVNQVAGRLNISASLLYDYYRVAEKWSTEHRLMYQSLDWTIYRNADPIEDAELLNKCIDEGWNATRFKEEKYPALTDPVNIIGRMVSNLNHYKKHFTETQWNRIKRIINELELLLQE